MVNWAAIHPAGLRWALRCLPTLLLVLSAFWPLLAQAQHSVRLEVDKHLVQVGEVVQVTVELSVTGRGGYDRYFPPQLQGFREAGGGMTSQNVEIINWQVRRRETHVYNVMPLREGKLTIGPAAVQVSGRTFRSATVTLDVRKGKLPGGAQAPGQAPLAGGPAAPAAPGARELETLFLHGGAAPKKVYVGQQVVAEWRLFTQTDVLGFQSTKQPTTDGFWVEDLESPQRLQFERTEVAGRVYYAALLGRKALFPQRAGKLIVGPMAAQVRTLNDFTSSASERQSPELTVEVLPLPTANQPPGFSNQNVGQYELSASLDRESVKGGDAVTLKLVIRGRGNLRQLKVPVLPAVDGFKVYEPKVSERLELSGGVSGEKLVEYLLLPTRAGRLRLPALSLPYFDPEAGKYRTAQAAGLTLTVTGQVEKDGPTRGRAERNVLERDIRPPRPPRPIAHETPFSPLKGITPWLVLFPAALFFGLTGGARLKARLSRPSAAATHRAVTRRVREHLERAVALETSGERGAFFGELAAALKEQLRLFLGQAVEGLTRDELGQVLEGAGLDAALARGVLEELDNCDFGRFAPSAASGPALSEAVARTRRLVSELARALRRRGA